MVPEEIRIIINVLERHGADWHDNPASLANRIQRALDDKGFEIRHKESNQ